MSDLGLVPLNDLMAEIGKRFDAFVFLGVGQKTTGDNPVHEWFHDCQGNPFTRMGLAVACMEREQKALDGTRVTDPQAGIGDDDDDLDQT